MQKEQQVATPSEASSKRRVVEQVSVAMSGPLPPPSDLARYNEVIPGLAQTIVNMAVKEQDHAHHMNQQMVTLEIQKTTESIKYLKRAQVACLFFCFIAIAGAVFLAMKGHDTVAALIVGPTMVSIAALLISGIFKKSHEENNSKK